MLAELKSRPQAACKRNGRRAKVRTALPARHCGVPAGSMCATRATNAPNSAVIS